MIKSYTEQIRDKIAFYIPYNDVFDDFSKKYNFVNSRIEGNKFIFTLSEASYNEVVLNIQDKILHIYGVAIKNNLKSFIHKGNGLWEASFDRKLKINKNDNISFQGSFDNPLLNTQYKVLEVLEQEALLYNGIEASNPNFNCHLPTAYNNGFNGVKNIAIHNASNFELSFEFVKSNLTSLDNNVLIQGGQLIDVNDYLTITQITQDNQKDQNQIIILEDSVSLNIDRQNTNTTGAFYTGNSSIFQSNETLRATIAVAYKPQEQIEGVYAPTPETYDKKLTQIKNGLQEALHSNLILLDGSYSSANIAIISANIGSQTVFAGRTAFVFEIECLIKQTQNLLQMDEEAFEISSVDFYKGKITY